MLIDQFRAAVAAARHTAALDDIAKLIYRANCETQITDAEAEAVFEAVQARRAAIAGGGVGRRLDAAAAVRAPRKPPRSPDRQRSLERRRRQAASGAMPPGLACRFTAGEMAVLAVVGRECQKAGACQWPLDQIAALAGVSRSTAKRAIRAAEAAGLLLRKERRRRGSRSDTNVLSIVSREWRSWLERGGGVQNRTSTITLSSKSSKTRPAEPQTERLRRAASPRATEKRGVRTGDFPNREDFGISAKAERTKS